MKVITSWKFERDNFRITHDGSSFRLEVEGDHGQWFATGDDDKADAAALMACAVEQAAERNGKVLVDQEGLRRGLEHDGRCGWHDCRRFAPIHPDQGRVLVRPHSGTCPLREDA